MKKYTLAFIFNASMDRVLLMHKSKPEWQAGRINGLGGKTEEGESSLDCIVREIMEEAGLKTDPTKWIMTGNLHAQSWSTDVFTYIYEGDEDDAQSLEEQKVEWFDARNLPPNVITNLNWLVPACLAKIKDAGFDTFSAKYIEV